MCVRACASSCSLAHPNTSRLITERESESGSRGSNSSFHQQRTKDGVFPLSSSSPPPPPLHFSLSLFFFFFSSSSSPPPALQLSWQSSTAIFTLPWFLARHTHTHTSAPPPHCAVCGKASEGRERDRQDTNFVSLHLPVRSDR